MMIYWILISGVDSPSCFFLSRGSKGACASVAGCSRERERGRGRAGWRRRGGRLLIITCTTCILSTIKGIERERESAEREDGRDRTRARELATGWRVYINSRGRGHWAVHTCALRMYMVIVQSVATRNCRGFVATSIERLYAVFTLSRVEFIKRYTS